jgi:flavorubredoxin
MSLRLMEVLGDEPILIDTSFPGRTRAILTEIEKLGLRPSDIAHILLTHHDGDYGIPLMTDQEVLPQNGLKVRTKSFFIFS